MPLNSPNYNNKHEGNDTKSLLNSESTKRQHAATNKDFSTYKLTDYKR